MPKVSVIIPVYNDAADLPRCIDSVLSQTYRNIEIILIDDDSNDGSESICDEYAAKDERIILVHLTVRSGVSTARNAGLRVCTGEFIHFADADDRMHPELIEIMAPLLSNDECALAACGYEHIIHSKNGEEVRAILPELSGDVSVEEYVSNCSSDNSAHASLLGFLWCKLFRMDIINRFQLTFDKDMALGEDTQFIVRYLEKCYGLVHVVPRPLYSYISGYTFGKMTVRDKYLPEITRQTLKNGAIFEEAFGQRLGTEGLRRLRGSFASMLIAQITSLCRRDALISRREIIARIAEVTSSPLAQMWFRDYSPQRSQSKVVPWFVALKLNFLIFILGRFKAEARYRRYFNERTTRHGLCAWLS